MAKVDYKGNCPDELWVVEDDKGFRTYVYEGQANLRLWKLLEKNYKAKIVKYVRVNNEDV
jgi:hypothetical protein